MDNEIKIDSLYKIYSGYVDTVAIENFSQTFKKGEIIALSGPSGSGKSTILNCIGGVLRPTSGDIFVGNKNIAKVSDNDLVLYRRDHVGLIYQDFNLINEFNIFENIALPMLIANKSKNEIDERVHELLTILGIERYEKSFPPYISGGERQRVAIAVALANNPQIILADEPTGNLDKKNSDNVINLLINQTRQLQKTLIIATHDEFILNQVDRIVKISN